jgi:hypothetical protein
VDPESTFFGVSVSKSNHVVAKPVVPAKPKEPNKSKPNSSAAVALVSGPVAPLVTMKRSIPAAEKPAASKSVSETKPVDPAPFQLATSKNTQSALVSPFSTVTAPFSATEFSAASALKAHDSTHTGLAKAIIPPNFQSSKSTNEELAVPLVRKKSVGGSMLSRPVGHLQNVLFSQSVEAIEPRDTETRDSERQASVTPAKSRVSLKASSSVTATPLDAAVSESISSVRLSQSTVSKTPSKQSLEPAPVQTSAVKPKPAKSDDPFEFDDEDDQPSVVRPSKSVQRKRAVKPAQTSSVDETATSDAPPVDFAGVAIPTAASKSRKSRGPVLNLVKMNLKRKWTYVTVSCH